VHKVLAYSFLLVIGLVASQFIGNAPHAVKTIITLATMVALSFIMIHVGYEFEIDRSKSRQFLWDYVVAGTAAAFPWVFCAMYFVFVMAPSELWSDGKLWRESLLTARFASPTSAGVLFSMLAAAGLGATWLFKKARVLAILDDLDTILLMIPLKIIMVGLKWQLLAMVLVIAALLWIAWHYLHAVNLPIRWPFVLSYAIVITGISEVIYLASTVIDDTVPIHLEVLLPAFVLGCILARPKGADPHSDDAREGVEEGPEDPKEQRVSTIVSACFMVLVGLSMAPIRAAGDDHFPGWGIIAAHVAAITVLSNLGKMFPTLCYRREASLRERIALSIGMFPRGEVGAGVLVIALSYGLGGPMLTVAVLSLALNLLLTGVFIVAVKGLIAPRRRLIGA
jgi:Kef-type K+ transport system membrane component KefB